MSTKGSVQMAQPPRADRETDDQYLRRANRIAATLGAPGRYTMKDVIERRRSMKLHGWQLYWRRWHFGWSKPYPDNSINGITHWLLFVGPLQLWFYL